MRTIKIDPLHAIVGTVVTLLTVGMFWTLRSAMPVPMHGTPAQPPDTGNVDCGVVTDDLRAALLNARLQARAFQDLLEDHYALKALHRESMQWGPLRSPRDCVREIILMEEDYWPRNHEAIIADAMHTESRLHDEVHEYRRALNDCEAATGMLPTVDYTSDYWASRPAHDGAHAIYPEGVDPESCPPGSMACPCIDGFACNGVLECHPRSWAPGGLNSGACF